MNANGPFGAESPTSSSDLRKAPAPAGESSTVLLVDDNPSIVRMCGNFLEEEGFHVIRAGDSLQALRLCRQYPGMIHLLITDLVLAPPTLQLRTGGVRSATMNGVQLMQQILAVRPRIKVILMSGHSDEHLESLYIFKGGRPFLRKPFGLMTLVGMAREVLEVREEAGPLMRTEGGAVAAGIERPRTAVPSK
ncbi:MAG: response regulator [Nitrospirae bacterium]|nr:MAG: response regulator [Nitrospirota bacterium]